VVKTKWYWQCIVYAVIILGAAATLFPFFYMVMTSFFKAAFTLPYPWEVLTSTPSLKSYFIVMERDQFGRYFANSILVTSVSMSVGMFFGSLTAYSFARFQFIGKEWIFRMFLFTMMIPGVLNIVPQFTIIRNMGLVDTYWGLWLLYIGGGMVGMAFFLRSFFESIPRELEESVVIDGGGNWTIYRHIYLPLSLPALGTQAIFSFSGTWDEYFVALTIIKSDTLRTLPIALQLMFGKYASNYAEIFAASIITIAPVILVYITCQKYFVQSGFKEGAVKG
jgi:multiple sugar transport system permease protein